METNRLVGIDVSHHQGKIDWERVKSSGIDFAIIRVGYSNRSGKGGLCFDKRYDYNIRQCNKLGIPVGVYVYCYDRSAAAATITVKALIKAIQKYTIEYPVVYDIEYDNKDLSKYTNTTIVNAAMKVIEDANYYGMVYASRDFFVNHLNMSDLKTSDKWEAAYTSVDNEIVQNGIWQYTSKGIVAGITGDVDKDYSYKDYASIIRKAGLNGLISEETIVNDSPKQIKKAVEQVSSASTEIKTVTANRLNVRCGPSKDYIAVKILRKGTKVTVLKREGDWANIGPDEWVSSKFIN